jgi:hypothetical protein
MKWIYCLLVLVSNQLVVYQAVELFKSIRINKRMVVFEYLIETTWDNRTLIGNHDPVKLELERDLNDEFLTINIRAPFFKQPGKPTQAPGEFFNLWDYEGWQINDYFS